MQRRERLMATLRGQPVDRPAVSFYEINGLDQDPTDPDPFNIFSHPSWRPLIELAAAKTDRIVLRKAPFRPSQPDPLEALAEEKVDLTGGSRRITRTLRAGRRTLACRTRRDPDVYTTWTVEHWLKDAADLRALLDLPGLGGEGAVEPAGVLAAEAALGQSGIVCLDTPDPLCLAAELFHMADYTVIALTEPALFRRLLERFAAALLPQTEAVARALPGRLWRIYGPEFASPPYLPPALFREYVNPYVGPMIAAIQRHGGFARIHCHGRLKAILPHIAALHPDALDPLEPPPQGDVELAEVRARYGAQMVLFGNLEASDIELLPAPQFAAKVRRALAEGTAGPGRGFVLMPSASPYGRVLSPLALKNYETIMELVENF